MPDETNPPSWRLDFISPAAERGREAGGSLLCEASGIVAGSQSAGLAPQTTEPLNRKERAQFNEVMRTMEEPELVQFAQRSGFFYEEAMFQKAFANRKIGEGAEQQVYHAFDGVRVLKTNDAIMHGTWLEFFNRLTLHNWLFLEVHYLLIGFTTVKNRLAAILQQPFVRGTRGASREEVEEDLKLRDFQRMRNDDYYNSELGILIEDLHDENVLVANETGVYLYFDPILYLETPDMGPSGKRLYRFPFKGNTAPKSTL